MKNSWAYHGDDGYTFSGDRAGTSFGPIFGGMKLEKLVVRPSSSVLSYLAGDIIGAGIDFSQNRAFFTKNGTLIGRLA